MEDEDEFEHLLEIYNKFPVTELIIHPRVQTDYYKNKPRMEYFLKALEISKNSGGLQRRYFYRRLVQTKAGTDFHYHCHSCRK